MNIAAAVKEAALNADFFNEKGLLKEYQPKQMNVLSGRNSTDKPIMIEFGCGLTPLSFNRKLTLQADTGADANAIDKKTFDELFPEVELEESTFLLQNFDKQVIKPIGSFRCFLRWKGHKYRVRIEVMGTDTPNILSREITFLMGILKRCLPVEKVPVEEIHPQIVQESNASNSLSVSDPIPWSLRTFSSVHGRSILSFSRREYSSVHGRQISNELCKHPEYIKSSRIR